MTTAHSNRRQAPFARIEALRRSSDGTQKQLQRNSQPHGDPSTGDRRTRGSRGAEYGATRTPSSIEDGADLACRSAKRGE